MLSLSGGGWRAALFHLGALTRLNELGLLAKVDVVGAVAGGSILAALLAARIPWPLGGAFRDWPEAVAEPMREIARRNARARALLRGPISNGGDETGLEERFARRLFESLGNEPPQRPRFIFGGAGLVLGEMGVDAEAAGAGGVHWRIDGVASPTGYAEDLVRDVIAAVRTDLDAFGAAEQAVLENHGYLLADAAIRARGIEIGGIEPLPPEPPHPHWMDEERVRAALAISSQRTRLGRLRPRRASRPNRDPEFASPKLTELLERLRPVIQYDSLESYRAISVAAVAGFANERRCNTLHRGDGEMIASVSPSGEEASLDISFLGAPIYANGKPAQRDDYLDESGGSHAVDAHSMWRASGETDVVYGYAKHDGDGRLWLQYWFFYYYNDKGLLNTGLHEGDWEMIQLRLDEDGEPDAVTYAQHAGGERAAWGEVEHERTEDGPVAIVYPARGSHASRLRRGSHEAPTVPDHNDGLGPRVRPRLVPIGDDGPGWVLWPGRWGATRRRESFEAESPRGPRLHRQWWNPDGFHREAQPAQAVPSGEAASVPLGAPPTPRLGARRDGDRALISYRFPEPAGGEPPAARIVVALYGDDSAPPSAQSFLVEGPEEEIALQIAPGTAPRGVRVSAASEHGVPGPTASVPFE